MSEIRKPDGNWRMAVAAAMLLAMTGLSAQAHHSASMFDGTKRIIFTGTVQKWVWANPHSWLYLRISRKDRPEEVWGFESGGTSMLIRAGWNAADIQIGDKVIVTAEPERTGQHLGLMEQVQLPNGRVLAGGGPPPGGLPGGPGPAAPVPYE